MEKKEKEEIEIKIPNFEAFKEKITYCEEFKDCNTDLETVHLSGLNFTKECFKTYNRCYDLFIFASSEKMLIFCPKKKKVIYEKDFSKWIKKVRDIMIQESSKDFPRRKRFRNFKYSDSFQIDLTFLQTGGNKILMLFKVQNHIISTKNIFWKKFIISKKENNLIKVQIYPMTNYKLMEFTPSHNTIIKPHLKRPNPRYDDPWLPPNLRDEMEKNKKLFDHVDVYLPENSTKNPISFKYKYYDEKIFVFFNKIQFSLKSHRSLKERFYFALIVPNKRLTTLQIFFSKKNSIVHLLSEKEKKSDHPNNEHIVDHFLITTFSTKTNKILRRGEIDLSKAKEMYTSEKEKVNLKDYEKEAFFFGERSIFIKKKKNYSTIFPR